MKKPKISKTKTDRVLRSIATYEKNLRRGTEHKLTPAAEAIAELKQFLNKDGTLSKSKLRTDKAKRAYNAAVDKYLSQYRTKKQRVSSLYESRTSGAAAALAGQGHFSGDAATKSAAAAKIFYSKTYNMLSNFMTSDDVIELVEHGYNDSDIDQILNFINRDINYRTPSELRSFREIDDVSVFIDSLTNIRQLAPEIPVEDAIQLADQMQRYGFDDTEGVIEQWRLDNNL